jgi:hypothetical protein
MQHVRLAFVNGQLLAEDEVKALQLRSLYRAPAQEEWRRLLYQAADILEHLGWCRGTFEYGRRHCAVGAIIAAYNQGEMRSAGCSRSDILRAPAVRWMIGRVTRHLGRLKNSGEMGLMAWNDGVARDGKEVAQLLRAAAQEANGSYRYDRSSGRAETIH